MADQKISELVQKASPDLTDYVELLDMDDTSNKKALLSALATLLAGSGDVKTALDAKQASDSDLTAIAALTTTAFGRSLLEAADASALRTLAALGTIATQAANNVSITGGSVTGITDLAVADGGTGASTAAAARTNLGVAPMTVVRKTADETVNNSTTLQNDNHLVLPVAASEVWSVEIRLLLGSVTTTPKFKLGFTFPAASTFYWGQLWHETAGSTPTYTITTGTLVQQSFTASTAALQLQGIYVGGANAGNVQFQWAQNVATAEDSKVLTNSCLIATKLA